jgi:predicted phosphodiesterase
MPDVRRLLPRRSWLRPWPFVVIVLATLAGAIGALSVYRSDQDLSTGTVRLGVDPGHRGALDIYVPLVDWGARFHAVRFPARLRIEARTIESQAIGRVAQGQVDVERLRLEARDAIETYIRRLVLLVAAAAFALGGLVALALRGTSRFGLVAKLGCAAGTAVVAAGAVALLLPPREPVENPEYYANGSAIPVALRVAQDATRSATAISQDLDDQLLNLARLISIPRERPDLRPLPRLTLASDLHNNLLALPALERAARGRPLFFAGDLTTSGVPLEAALTREVARAGRPFVFVSGNHDSDTLSRTLARQGAIVLTQRGRLLPNGRHGSVVVRAGGLRVAGYSDPFERRRADGYRARREPEVNESQQRAFWEWLRPLLGHIDVVMVHSPALAALALEELRASPPAAPLVFLTGHTHEQELIESEHLAVVNGGTVGGGGAGNFHENQPYGLAILTYRARPSFDPLAADLVRIDAPDGSANAERRLLELASDAPE